jgi:hypothetical protein
MLPEDAPRLCAEGGYWAFDLTIVAFNGRGDSASDTYGVGTCDLAPDPGEVGLPGTGSGFREATSSWQSPYLQTLVASALAASGVLALAVYTARRR